MLTSLRILFCDKQIPGLNVKAENDGGQSTWLHVYSVQQRQSDVQAQVWRDEDEPRTRAGVDVA